MEISPKKKKKKIYTWLLSTCEVLNITTRERNAKQNHRKIPITPIKMTTPKTGEDNCAGAHVKELEACALLMGTRRGAAAPETV